MRTRKDISFLVQIPNPSHPVTVESGPVIVEDLPVLRRLHAGIRLSSFEPEDEVHVRRLRLEGRLRFRITDSCARCLKETSKNFVTTFLSMIDLSERTVTALDLHSPPEPGGYRRVGEEYIDLRDEILQRIHLEFPRKILCRSDCRGLCPNCGHDLNTGSCSCPPPEPDGPFAALKNWILD
ncbi:MAG: DUF177 domain-containing protein [Candidatus Hydrogenedentota bacterium]|nr:MAG: DUF177 domain-containing protein [Candidatus Hydrogenedentota bacterium]